MKIILLTLATIFLNSFAFAESTIGNGGDLVVCRDSAGAIQQTELLDLFEAKKLYSRTLDLGVTQLSVTEKMELVFKRIEAISSKRASILRTEYEKFKTQTSYISGVDFIDIPDSDHSMLPKGCNIEQVAIRRTDVFPGEAIYKVNLDLWNKMDNDNQAALILHELVYGLANDSGSKNSRASRYFVGLATSNDITKLSLNDYLKMIKLVFNSKSGYEDVDLKCTQDIHIKYLFVIDDSGSNNYTDSKGETRIESVKNFVAGSSEHCRFGLINFSHAAQTLTQDTSGKGAFFDKQKFSRIFDLIQFQSMGNTVYSEALFHAEQMISQNDLQPTVIIFLTDGTPTENYMATDYINMIKNIQAQGVVYFSALGYGHAAPAELLSEMTAQGMGRYLQIQSGVADLTKLIP